MREHQGRTKEECFGSGGEKDKEKEVGKAEGGEAEEERARCDEWGWD